MGVELEETQATQASQAQRPLMVGYPYYEEVRMEVELAERRRRKRRSLGLGGRLSF